MLTLAFTLVFAVSKEIGPGADLEVEFNALIAGDELVLRGGVYMLPVDRFSIDNAIGTAQKPIVIRSKPGERAHLIRADINQNIIDIGKADYLEFHDIEFE